MKLKKFLSLIIIGLFLLMSIMGCQEKSTSRLKTSIILFYNDEIITGNTLTVYFDGTPKEGPRPVLSCNGEYLYNEFVNLTYKDEHGMMSNKPYTKIGKYTLSYHYKGNKTYATSSRSFDLTIILPPEE